MFRRMCVCVWVGGWVTAGALSSVFSIINSSEDSQKGVSSMPDALSISCSLSQSHTHTHAQKHRNWNQTHKNAPRSESLFCVTSFQSIQPLQKATHSPNNTIKSNGEW